MNTKVNTQVNAFDALLSELDVLSKAMPEAIDGDEKIAAADGEGDEDEDDEKNKKGEFPAEGELAKSFKVTLENGDEIEAQDGTELVKSLMHRIDTNEDTLAKAFSSAINLIKTQGEQLQKNNALVKSLQTQVMALSEAGRGRKATLSIHEKPDNLLNKSNDDGITQVEFMAKANTAFDNGRITGKDLTVIDVSFRNNTAIDPTIINKVLS